MDDLDPRYLDGLQVNYAEPVVDDACGDEGDEIPKAVPLQRDATMDDVLNWADHGDTIVIITSDGQQHEVAKLPED